MSVMDRQQIEAILNTDTVQITTRTGHTVLGKPICYTDRPSFLIERPDGRRELVVVDEPGLQVVNLDRSFPLRPWRLPGVRRGREGVVRGRVRDGGSGGPAVSERSVNAGIASTLYENLPPTEYLVMEVLAARYRTGEQIWTFPRRLRPAIRSLATKGLAFEMSGIVPETIRAGMTDVGRETWIKGDFETPDQRELREVKRELADTNELYLRTLGQLMEATA